MDAEHATEGRLVTPNTSASLSVHVVASPASHGARVGGGVTVVSLENTKTRKLTYNDSSDRWPSTVSVLAG